MNVFNVQMSQRNYSKKETKWANENDSGERARVKPDRERESLKNRHEVVRKTAVLATFEISKNLYLVGWVE